jgi:DNA-binding NarL/FixJ family response regulator
LSEVPSSRILDDVTLRIVLVDDSTQFLDTAEDFLSRERQLSIVGRAQNGAEAIEIVRALRPDLVLMDVSMPGMDGLEATRHIKALAAAPRVVILTLRDTPRDRAAALAIADGFVSKADFGGALLPMVDGLFERKDQIHDGD